MSGEDPGFVAGPPQTTVFRNYRRAAIWTYVWSDILLVAAVVSWVWFDKVLAVFLGFFAVVLTISSLRSAQVAFIRSGIEDRIDRGETVLAQIGGRRHVRASLFRAPLFVVLTDRYLYAWTIGVKPGPPDVRRAYNDLLAVGWGERSKALTLVIELPDRRLEMVGLMLDELERFEEVLAVKRPGLVGEALSPRLAAAFDD